MRVFLRFFQGARVVSESPQVEARLMHEPQLIAWEAYSLAMPEFTFTAKTDFSGYTHFQIVEHQELDHDRPLYEDKMSRISFSSMPRKGEIVHINLSPFVYVRRVL